MSKKKKKDPWELKYSMLAVIGTVLFWAMVCVAIFGLFILFCTHVWFA